MLRELALIKLMIAGSPTFVGGGNASADLLNASSKSGTQFVAGQNFFGREARSRKYIVSATSYDAQAGRG